MMAWSRRQTLLAGLTAVALLSGAAGPCLCLVGDHVCHRTAETRDAHSCCQTPTGTQAAVADDCCEGGCVLVMATTEVPEVGPPVLRSGLPGPVHQNGVRQPVAPVRFLSPLPLERTTVLLI
jgi:hypothetical protein